MLILAFIHQKVIHKLNHFTFIHKSPFKLVIYIILIFHYLQTGYSFGFGFVNYSREEDAAKAIAQLNGLQVQNKKLKVSYARPSGDDIKETNLYVTNLPRYVSS